MKDLVSQRKKALARPKPENITIFMWFFLLRNVGLGKFPPVDDSFGGNLDTAGTFGGNRDEAAIFDRTETGICGSAQDPI